MSLLLLILLSTSLVIGSLILMRELLGSVKIVNITLRKLEIFNNYIRYTLPVTCNLETYNVFDIVYINYSGD